MPSTPSLTDRLNAASGEMVEVSIDGKPIEGLRSVQMHRDPVRYATRLEITTDRPTKETPAMQMPSSHTAPSGRSTLRRDPARADRPEVRQTIARLIEEGLRSALAPEIDDALVLDDEADNDGPLGGTSSSVLAYVTLAGETEPVAVAINVYADDKIAEKAEARLDEIEAQTALADRLARVRGLLGEDA